jgi:carbonic anhydrase
LKEGALVDRIREGVRRFQREVFPQRRSVYEDLAATQTPTALFITCGDSRIDPEMLTQSGPGEIFVERNPGNIVPVYERSAKVGVSASTTAKTTHDSQKRIGSRTGIL